jgi:hypothetical protein
MKKASPAEQEGAVMKVDQELELLGPGWAWLTSDEGIVWAVELVDRMGEVIAADDNEQLSALGTKARL